MNIETANPSQIAPQKKLRPLLVKYCGRRTENKDYVWYDIPFKDMLDGYFNTGDICVHDSTMRLLDTLQPEDLNIDNPVNDQQVQFFKERCNVIVLRGSNYIHEEMNWTHFADWIEALDMPVVCIGVGAQSSIERDIILPPDGLRVWKAISERCPAIGVRGAFTAETLHRNGIHNVEIVGCPTIFRGKNQNLTLRHNKNGPERITFSIRREVGPDYAENQAEFLSLQKRIIAKLDLCSDLYLSCHGEPEEKAFFYKAPAHMRKAAEKMITEGWFDETTGKLLMSLYERRMYYVGAPGEYDVYSQQFDAAMGYRVHAVLPAVAMGTPGILFSYDTRSRELANAFDLPIFTPKEFEKISLSDAFDPSRFNAFTSAFPQRYAAMKAFIERFGLQSFM